MLLYLFLFPALFLSIAKAGPKKDLHREIKDLEPGYIEKHHLQVNQVKNSMFKIEGKVIDMQWCELNQDKDDRYIFVLTSKGLLYRTENHGFT